MRPWRLATLCSLALTLAAIAGQAWPAAPHRRPVAGTAIATAVRQNDDGCEHLASGVDGEHAIVEALAACPDRAPVLRVEIGMHIAPITGISADRDCTLLATGSSDKTVRLWSISDGRLLRTVRLPIESGNGGKAYAVALSPDGAALAVGGWDAAYARKGSMGMSIVDLASGGVMHFDGFEDVVDVIAFSADGIRIAVGLHGGRGVRVLERRTGREVMADRDYDGDVYGLSFGPDGSLFATSWDGDVRRYGPDLVLAVRAKAPGGAQPHAIAVDSSGRRLAVGYGDRAAVSILDASTLRRIAEGDVADLTEAELPSVAWTADGQTIVAGGVAGMSYAGRRFFMRRFDRDGRRIGTDLAGSGDSVTDLKPCGSAVAFATADPTFGLIDAEGSPKYLQGPAAADMRGKLGEDLLVSEDGGKVRFGVGFGGERPVLFDIAAGTLASAPEMPSDLHAADISSLAVTGWHDGASPMVDGRPIVLDPQEIAHSLSIDPGGGGFAIGTGSRLRDLAADGTKRWDVPVPGTVWGLDASGDGRVVVAACGDGTLRWHRSSDGRELLALFVDARNMRWVAWTPAGYYMASPGGEDLIGWHVNRGWAQQADFFPASRFRDRFARPDVVRTVLRTLDEDEAVRQADEVAHRHVDDKPVIERLPPVVTITSPTDGAAAPSGPVEVKFTVRLPSGGKLDRVDAFVDGAKVEARGLAPPTRPTPDGEVRSLTLPMPDHDATISIVAYAGGKAGDAARLTLKAISQPPPVTPPKDTDVLKDPDTLKPSLYALLVGVSAYDDAHYALAYPAIDAEGFAVALKAQEGRLYRHVEVKVLTDREATATGIKRGLTWLARQATARDLAIVYAAGHGMTDAKGKFWFLSSDMDPADVSATAVSQDDIENVLFDLPGKKLLFLDACHAGAALNVGSRGGADVSAAISDFAQTEGGVVAYAASTGREFSFERDDWGHGAFTKALIEGFNGQADILHKGTVTTATLDLFVEQRVKELTGGQQHPVMTRPKTVPDFPIASVQ